MITKETLAEMYKQLYTIRRFETECIKLYRKGSIRGYFHPYLGEEAVAVGVCAALRPGDYIASTHRGHGHCIARGADIGKMIAELFGKKAGYCKGRGGSMHIADAATGNLGANGIVGGGIPIAVGAALGISIRGEQRVSVGFCSDGASNNGVFAESLNLAAIWNLPFILVIENNHYAVSTPIEQTSRDPDLYKRAEGYAVTAGKVDGNDVLEVFKKAREAVELCGAGKGPVVIEAKTYRQMGHHVNDPGTYMPKEKLEYYKSKDPVAIGREYFLRKGTEAEAAAIEEEAESTLEKAIKFASEAENPDVAEFLREIESY